MKLIAFNPPERDSNGRVLGYPEAKPWSGNTKKLAATATVAGAVATANKRDFGYAAHYREHGTWRLKRKYLQGLRVSADDIPLPADPPTIEQLDELAAGQHRLIQGARGGLEQSAAIDQDWRLVDEEERHRLYLACEMNRQLIATANACAQHERWLRQFYYPTTERLERNR